MENNNLLLPYWVKIMLEEGLLEGEKV